jgi:predicted AAA+ superfamily ATPase
MYRKDIKQLLQWKLSTDRKPLLILGARQVGKTWLLKEFGNTEYRQMVYINFEEEKQMQALFVPDFSISRIISALEAYSGHKIEPAETLIVFDEIQNGLEINSFAVGKRKSQIHLRTYKRGSAGERV